MSKNKLLIIIVASIVLIMVIFPPVYSCYVDADMGGGYSFTGYEFVFNIYKSRSIDIGRLFLQLLALGAITAIIYCIINTAKE